MKLYSAIGVCRYVWLLYGYSHTEFMHLICLYTHFNMMHGTYNVKYLAVFRRMAIPPSSTLKIQEAVAFEISVNL